MNNRIIYFDYFRIISIFAIVILHVAAHNWENIEVSSFEWQILNIFDGSVRWGVPIFFMISGALFLERKQSIKLIYKKYIFRIVCAFGFWSALYAVWDNFFVLKNYSFKSLVSKICFGHYHMWFLFVIVGLYIIVPVLCKIVNEKKTALYFFLIASVFGFFLPQCIEIIGMKSMYISQIINEFLSKLKLYMVLGYSGYFILGFLLNSCDIKDRFRKIMYVLGFLGIIFTILSTAFYSVACNSPTEIFYDYLSINTLFSATSVFVFAKYHFNRPFKRHLLFLSNKQSVLPFLSKCSFGVYLVHPLVIEILDIKFSVFSTPFNPLLYVPVLSIVVFAISLLVSIIINRIPFLRTWVA